MHLRQAGFQTCRVQRVNFANLNPNFSTFAQSVIIVNPKQK